MLAQHPGGHHFIECPKETVGHDLGRHLRAKEPPRLSIADSSARQGEVLDHVVVRELGQEARALPQLHLEDDGEVAVRAQRVKVQERQAAQPFGRVGNLLQFGARMTHECVEGGVDGRLQDLFLVLEVKIDRTIGNVGAVGDVGDAGGEETLLGKHGHRSIEDALVLLGRTVVDHHTAAGIQGRLWVVLHTGLRIKADGELHSHGEQRTKERGRMNAHSF